MAPRKKADTAKPLKEYKTKSTVTKTDILRNADGTIDGEYSRSVYVNGELISFDIDWDKLKEHMKKVG
jgi:hypothetical protein